MGALILTQQGQRQAFTRPLAQKVSSAITPNYTQSWQYGSLAERWINNVCIKGPWERCVSWRGKLGVCWVAEGERCSTVLPDARDRLGWDPSVGTVPGGPVSPAAVGLQGPQTCSLQRRVLWRPSPAQFPLEDYGSFLRARNNNKINKTKPRVRPPRSTSVVKWEHLLEADWRQFPTTSPSRKMLGHLSSQISSLPISLAKR